MERVKLTPEQMNKLKQHEIDLLLELDRICKKHSITYAIGYGSLIGAVRHKGFIPWDDDVDVYMTRDAYLRFREVCKTELDNRFFYQTHKTDSDYYYLFDKLRANGTVFKEHALKNRNINHGVYLDIFPVDNLPNNKILSKFHYMRYRFCRMGLNSKYMALSSRQGKKKIAAIALRILLAPVSMEFLYNTAEKLATKYNHPSNKYACCYASTYKRKDIFPSNFFTEVIPSTFEGHSIWIPAHYDEILTQIYGDYMQLPPIEKQYTFHYLSEVKL